MIVTKGSLCSGWGRHDAATGDRSLHGYASSLSIGVDALLNGDHAATGRHDSRRTSGGRWQRFVPKPFDEVFS